MNFITADSSGSLLDTSLPLATSSSFPTSTVTDSNFYDTANWHSLSLPAGTEQFSGNALHHALASGSTPLVMTTEEQISLLAMVPTQTSFDSSMSIPIEPSKTSASIPPQCKLTKVDYSQSGSSSTSLHTRNSQSPEQLPHARLPLSAKSSPPNELSSKVEKRKANTLAARRYRQKRVDQMSGLEAELREVKADRDDYRVRCAKLEGEVEALRALLRSQK